MGKPRVRLHGSETLTGLAGSSNDVSVLDFWQWAFSDLCANNIRGVFAEWMVAKILELPQPVRDSWHPWDLVTPDGVTIEVKTSAYVQSWEQPNPSKILFGGLRGRLLDAKTNKYDQQATFNADLYVFCVQIEKDVSIWDALRLEQWRFYMVQNPQLAKVNCRTLSLSTVKTMSPEMNATEFREAALHMTKDIAASRVALVRE
jgi:hypothetical protein